MATVVVSVNLTRKKVMIAG